MTGIRRIASDNPGISAGNLTKVDRSIRTSIGFSGTQSALHPPRMQIGRHALLWFIPGACAPVFFLFGALRRFPQGIEFGRVSSGDAGAAPYKRRFDGAKTRFEFTTGGAQRRLRIDI